MWVCKSLIFRNIVLRIFKVFVILYYEKKTLSNLTNSKRFLFGKVNILGMRPGCVNQEWVSSTESEIFNLDYKKLLQSSLLPPLLRLGDEEVVFLVVFQLLLDALHY